MKKTALYIVMIITVLVMALGSMGIATAETVTTGGRAVENDATGTHCYSIATKVTNPDLELKQHHLALTCSTALPFSSGHYTLIRTNMTTYSAENGKVFCDADLDADPELAIRDYDGVYLLNKDGSGVYVSFNENARPDGVMQNNNRPAVQNFLYRNLSYFHPVDRDGNTGPMLSIQDRCPQR